MSPPFHNLRYRVFCYATEDPSRVLAALANVVGDVDPGTDAAETHFGAPITVYSGKIVDSDRIDGLLRDVAASLGKDLRAQAGKRLDDDNVLHLNLDKQAAYNGHLVWARGGDAIAVSGTVEAYPAKREKALAALEGYLDDVMEQDEEE